MPSNNQPLIELIQRIKPDFADQIVNWYRQHGRKDLPWQVADPYAVWVSEIMLQQTQVQTVIPYYQRFMTSFPNVSELAAASTDDVLAHWQGLGYYARGRNLHRAAQEIVDQFDGQMPESLANLMSLPGIGRSTAAAIVSLAYDKPATILDGNVKRVLTRLLTYGENLNNTAGITPLWEAAEQLTPSNNNRIYTQAMMDIGATICTRTKPKCSLCPINQYCQALATNQQHAFPNKTKKKPMPLKKRIGLLIISDLGAVYLTKRPDKGIWGGLWSFPEFEDIEVMKDALGISAQQLQLTDEQHHQFTHYKLALTLIQCKHPHPKQLARLQGEWYNSGQKFGGVSSAVRKWLASKQQPLPL